MNRVLRLAVLGSAALVLTACTSLLADIDSGGSPQLTVNGCPIGETWTRESVAAAVNLAPATIVALKDLRGLSLEEICTMPPRRLARAVSRVSGKQRPDSPDKADAFRELQRAGDDGRVRPDGLFRALEQRRELLSMPKVAGVIREAWTPIGPANIGGLVRSILTHPTDPNSLLVGSVSGGLWRSTDAGASWHFINDFLPNTVVSSLARDPVTPNRIYAGTGGGISARTFGGSRGLGVFVSDDGGLTWAQMGGTMPDFTLATDQSDFFLVNRVITHATNPDIVVVATSGQFTNYGGVWRTLNATAATPTWRKIYDRRALDVQFDPHSPNSIIIGEGEHFYCGTNCTSDPNAGEDGGAVGRVADVTTAGSTAPGLPFTPAAYTYTRHKLEVAVNTRVEVAFATATAGLAVAVIDSNGGSGGFGRMHSSNDGGITWTFNSQPAHMGAQGFWNNSVWIDPTDSTRIVVGGIDLYRGAGVHNWWVHHNPVTWTKISSWFTDNSVHADNHAIVPATGYNGTTNRQVYVGNDGGIYRSNDIAHHNGSNFVTGWNNLSNNGLAITQFYSVAGRNDYPGGVTRIIGGTQDNGSLVAPASGTSWASFYGGDGGFSAVDPLDPSTFYGEYVYGSVARSTTGGEASPICGGPNPITESLADDPPFVNCGPGATSEANFIAPFVLDPNNPNTLLLGARSLWRSTNVKAAQPDWHTARGHSGGLLNYVSAIAVAQGNSDLVWIGYNNGSVFCTTNGTAPTPTWTQVTTVPNRMILRIMIDAANHNRVFVTRGGYFGNNITEFTDPVQACKVGPTATSRHGNLPQAPVRSIVRHPANPAWLYAGSEVGVFASTDGGVTWSTSNDGPAATSAEELIWLDSSTLVVATFGRGMFRTTVSPGAIQLSASAVSVAETTGTVTISATRTGGNAGAVGVSYGTSPGTAVAGVNFTSTAGNLFWADGDVATQSFTVPILDDGLAAGTRAFNVSLSSPTGGATVGAPASAAVSIQDSGHTAPGAPVIGAATRGNGQATIAFTAPASNGGSPITGYTASCTPGPITATGPGTTSQIVVTGLANGTGYTCSVTATNAFGTGQPSAPVSVTPTAGGAATPRLTASATRMPVGTGDNVMIVGFIIGGTANKTVAIVGYGPSLAAGGITDPLANPTMSVVRASDRTVIATNDDWGTAANAAQLQATGFAPPDTLEPAALMNLAPGAYTAIVSGVDGGTGVGLVAVYEVDQPEVPLSAGSGRGLVLTGDDVMIGGFIIQGDGPQTVAIVAYGPSRADSGIANLLANPTMSIVRASDRAVIATNDDWGTAANAAQLQAAGFAPPNALESAILVTLQPGAYTAVVSGVGGGTGVSVIAVYAVP